MGGAGGVVFEPRRRKGRKEGGKRGWGRALTGPFGRATAIRVKRIGSSGEQTATEMRAFCQQLILGVAHRAGQGTAPTAHRPSPITHRPSPIAHRPSPIAHRPSPIAHHLSPIAYRLSICQPTICRLLRENSMPTSMISVWPFRYLAA